MFSKSRVSLLRREGSAVLLKYEVYCKKKIFFDIGNIGLTVLV